MKTVRDIFPLMLLGLFWLGLFLPAMAQNMSAPAPDSEYTKHVGIRLVPERTHVEAGETIYIGIEQTIDEHWHTYWVNPGDSGEPMTVSWDLPEGFETGDMEWPAPEKIYIGPLASYGYEGTATILQPLFVPTELQEGPVTLTADIELLVCAEICIPEYTTASLTLNEGEARDNSDFIEEAYANLPAPTQWTTKYWEEDGMFVVQTELLIPSFVELLAESPEFKLIPKDWGLIDNAAETETTIEQRYLTLRQKRGDRPLKALDKIEGVATYIGIEGAKRAMAFTAFPDKTRETIAVSPAADAALQQDTQTSAPPIENKTTLLLAIVFALLGGMILNLMPCVFPVLSLKALKLVKLKDKELAEARIDSLLYTAGILVSFTILASVLITLQGAGEQIGWGFQLQNPVFVLCLSWLLFVIGLNLSGFFEFGTSVTGFGGKLVQGRGRTASFMTGVLAAVVATPCTAPFMGIAMGFALTQPTPVTLLVFAVLGLGLALPYVLLAVVPALRNIMPKPGAWMETFKQFLAFPLYLSAIWLVWVYSMQGDGWNTVMALSGAVTLTFIIWLLKLSKQKNRKSSFIKLLALICLSLLIYATHHHTKAHGNATNQTQISSGTWEDYSREKLDQALAGDQPVFVNMTAAWCITCKVNEKTVLAKQDTQDLFAKNNVLLFKGDWTNRNDGISQYLESFGRNGVPIYVYYGPRQSDGKRPAPQVLPQILTSGAIRELF